MYEGTCRMIMKISSQVVFFDKHYQTDIDELREFQEAYISDMQGFLNALNANLKNAFPKLAMLEKTIESNIHLIAGRLSALATVVTLESVK